MGKIFEEDKDTIGWGEGDIGARTKKYTPEIIGATDRIFIMSPVKKRMQHYIDKVGYVKCSGGLCCELAENPAEFRLGAVIFKYETDKRGNLPQDANGENIIRGEIMLLIMTEKMYARFREANDHQKSESDGKESLSTVDVMVSIESAHKKKWKQWDVKLSRRSFFRSWASKAAQSKDKEGNVIPGDKEIAEQFNVFKKEMKTLWDKLGSDLAREYTETELAEKVGRSGDGDPGDLPDVADPTDSLAGLDE